MELPKATQLFQKLYAKLLDSKTGSEVPSYVESHKQITEPNSQG